MEKHKSSLHLTPMNPETIYDVIIIGAGPGGCSCAMWVKQLGFSVGVIEKNNQCGGLQLKNPYENTFIATSVGLNGTQIAQKMHENMMYHQIPLQLGVGAQRLSSPAPGTDDPWKVLLENETVYKARYIVLATGVEHKTMGWKARSNLILGSGSVVSTRRYDGQHVAILGGGDSAFENYRFVKERGAKGATVFARTIRASITQVQQVPPEDVVLGEYQFDPQTNTVNGVAFEQVIVLYGYEVPQSALLGLNVALNDRGFVKVTQEGQTSIPGVYAIGELVHTMHPCTITSMAQGIEVAKALQHKLSEQPLKKYTSLVKRSFNFGKTWIQGQGTST